MATVIATGAGPHLAAFAQTEQTTPGAAKPASPSSLRAYLDKLQYDAGERGPLLVVAPDETVKPDPDLPPAESAGRLPLATLARFAGRKAVRVGEVTVLAPSTMKVIKKKQTPSRDCGRTTRFSFSWEHSLPRSGKWLAAQEASASMT